MMEGGGEPPKEFVQGKRAGKKIRADMKAKKNNCAEDKPWKEKFLHKIWTEKKIVQAENVRRDNKMK